MDKKTIILVAILALLLIFYFPIMEFLGLYKPSPEKTSGKEDMVIDSLGREYQQAHNAVDTFKVTDTTVASSTSPSTAAAPEQAKPESTMTATEAMTHDTVVVNTRQYTAILTSFGGGPVSLKLRNYYYRDGGEIEMLPAAESATPEASFAGGSFSSSRVNYQCSLSPGKYDATSDTVNLTYTYVSKDGGEIIKHYSFYPNKYNFNLVVEVKNRVKLGFERQYTLMWNTPLGVTEPQPETDYQAMEAVAMQAGSRETLKDFKDDKLSQVLPGNSSWAGVRSKYFAAVIIPRNREADAVLARGSKDKIMVDGKSIEQKLITAGVEMPFAAVGQFADTFSVFVGPLDYNLMASYHIGLQDILGIGTTPFVGWIIKPFAVGIMWLLPRMYKVIPNYGLVIIIFALLIKIITMPLSMKSFKSMNAMKELQPKIEELKQKHKKNPQAMNQEMMRLYKTHGVNPISGCLPMLPQMPLFFALFSVFRSTILLRNANFVWFITDLSRGASSFTDPYIILVVIMIVGQFLSQKLTMASTQQNKMMGYVMPLFMGFLFYRFSAGLVLYWTCFAFFSLLDYVAFKRKAIKNPDVKTA